jgi:mycothiol synthase
MSLSPLSERVDAPADLHPEPVPGVVWRPASLDDLDTVVGLYAAMAAVDHPEWAEQRDEIEQEFGLSWVDLSRDTLLAMVDGTAVAFGQAFAPADPETVVRSVLFGGVGPAFRGRGIGRSLLAWLEGRARQQLAASGLSMPGWIMVYSEETNARAAALFDRVGFSTERYFWQLSRVLESPIPDLALPDALRLAAVTPDLWERIRVAKNDAFRDHWGTQPTAKEPWDGWMAMPSRRPDLSFLALEGDEVVGLVLTDVNEDDWERQGFTGSYISLVGVVARWRRQGVAPALLASSMRASREAGLECTVLDVDSASPTGALGLYTGMGFTQVNGSRAHVKAF